MADRELRIPAPAWHTPPRHLRLVQPAPRRFLLSITRADGTTENLQRQGGTSMDHTIEGIERGGQVVRVLPLLEGDAA
jgi:hypothetical protein